MRRVSNKHTPVRRGQFESLWSSKIGNALFILVVSLIVCNLFTLYLLNNTINNQSIECSHHSLLQPFTNDFDRSTDPKHYQLSYLPQSHTHSDENEHDHLSAHNERASVPPPKKSKIQLPSMSSPSSAFSKNRLRMPKMGSSFASAASPLIFTTDDGFVCDFTMEYMFNESIRTLQSLKERDYMPAMTCPDNVKTGWRPGGAYQPMILGNQCEPWWHRDAIYITSRLLNKRMKALEYGSGTSSVWLSMHVGYIVAIESDIGWTEGLRNFTKILSIENLEILHRGLGRKYTEPDFSEHFGDFVWEPSVDGRGGIDFISVDGRLRKPCLEYVLGICEHCDTPAMIKPNGGILLFDNSDRPAEDGINATWVVPKHWLKYESFNWDKHVSPLTSKRWLDNSQTTLWISRDERCLQFL